MKVHGESDPPTRLYDCWRNMRRRCRIRPNHPNYEYYKHVTLHPAWNDYTVFKKWALANGYSDTLEIDRRDSKKGYTPDNCRWVTEQVQAKNTTWTEKRNTALTRARMKQRTPVICIDTGEEFSTLNAAAKAYGVYFNAIKAGIENGWRAAGKYWKYKHKGKRVPKCHRG